MSNALISSALSLTMAGNTGISPFLTLLILGLIEITNPELLNMGQTMEIILASWWSIAILGVLTIGEMVGKCIPAIDEIIDSAEVFVVPAVSILASMATLGLLSGDENPQLGAGQGQNVDIIGLLEGDDVGDGYRSLQDQLGDSNEFGEGFITFAKICLVAAGMGLALLIHFFKMLVRVSSLIFTAGCCQPCITILESLVVVFGVVLSILVPTFAVVACIILLIAAGYAIRVRCYKKKYGNDTAAAAITTDDRVESKVATDADNFNIDIDIEHQNASSTAIAELVVIPLAPPIQAKPDFEATTY
mmetsp:Transcript_1744/g.3785  ORF Transcript_1744/g.3785 Transcript_1744/m.3785 type:complete len:304 (-) Transcript_1744:454-1365(-)